jgi:hypothetical protein
MEMRQFAGWSFALLGGIEPDRLPNGAFAELLPQPRYRSAASSHLHGYGDGPFCRFRIGKGNRGAGLYILTRSDTPVYAGECANLDRRWGPGGYGGISPRNCYHGGQQTNCRINAAILAAAMGGHHLKLWFVAIDGNTEARRNCETELIQHLRPAWNLAKMR